MQKDKRRSDGEDNRRYFVAGRWAAVGRSRAGIDKPHWAKPGGDISNMDPELLVLLRHFGEVATGLLARYRPDIVEILRRFSFEDVFGLFHIFFSPKGATKLHRDPNDFICFVFPVEAEDNLQGGLEIGETSVCFQAKVGDATLLDSDELLHGSREYRGDPSKRIVGIFSIQKSYLRLRGVEYQ